MDSAARTPAQIAFASTRRSAAASALLAITAAIIAMASRALTQPWLGDGTVFLFAFPAVAVCARWGGLYAALGTAVLCAGWYLSPLPPSPSQGSGLLESALFLASAAFIVWICAPAERIVAAPSGPTTETDPEGDSATIFWLRTGVLLSVLIPWALFAAVALYAHHATLRDTQQRMERLAVIAQEHAQQAFQSGAAPQAEALTPFYRQLASTQEGTVLTLLAADGRLIARWPQPPDPSVRTTSSGPLLSAVARGEHEGLLRGVSVFDGVRRIAAFRQVPGQSVYVVAGTDESAALSAWRRELASLAAFILPLSLCLAAISWQALRRTQRLIEASRLLQREAQERQKVEAALRQSQKLEAMGHLTGGVAHDFNNLLMVVNLNATLLRQKVGAEHARQLEAIERAVGAGKKLTRQLLAFSRRQPLVPRVVELAELMPALEDLVRPALGSAVGLEVQVEPGTRPVKIDTGEFELAIINLAINARDAMPDGGQLRVAARNDGDFVEVAVSDTGTGIAPEDLERVFEPFYTTKPVGAGTGLGLSQVYGLCARAGGSARIESELGKGTTVVLRFPAAQPEQGAAGASEPPRPTLERLALRVLMVEDNRDVAIATRELLEGTGCRVVHASQPDEALEVLERDSRFDLVLSDIVMPGGMDGLQLVEELKRRYPKLRVVLMTGYAEKLGEAEAKKLVVLPKPFDATLLVRTLREQAATPA